MCKQPPERGTEVQVSVLLFVLNKRKEEKECGATEELRQGCGITKL